MDGDEAPLEAYAELCKASGAHLIVDEAHAVGVYGARGSGLIEARGVEDAVCLSVNTAGKALGVSGAFVAGADWAVEYLIQRARPFIFSTAAPPAIGPAIEASLDLVEREPWRRQRVLERSTDLRRRLGQAGLPPPAGESQIVPVIVGDNARALTVADALAAAGFDVRAIRPPTVPAGSARLRVSVNVNVTTDHICGFVETLTEALAATRGRCFAGSS
jgi:8-amino-7-oxononanoate synthase